MFYHSKHDSLHKIIILFMSNSKNLVVRDTKKKVTTRQEWIYIFYLFLLYYSRFLWFFMNVFIYSFISLIFWGTSPYYVPGHSTECYRWAQYTRSLLFSELLITVTELSFFKNIVQLCLYAFGHTDPSALNVSSYLNHVMSFLLSLRLNCAVSRCLASFISEILCEFHYFNNTVAYI